MSDVCLKVLAAAGISSSIAVPTTAIRVEGLPRT